MSPLQSPVSVDDDGAATKHDTDNSTTRTAIAHLPQVYNLTWNDDFFDGILAAVVVFDLNVKNATITPPTHLWLTPWNLCHLALTMNSIIVVYKRPTLFDPFSFCQEGQIEYEHVPYDCVAEVTMNHDDGCISFLYRNTNQDQQQRWIRGIDRPEEFDHALVALQENFYRSKHNSQAATTR